MNSWWQNLIPFGRKTKYVNGIFGMDGDFKADQYNLNQPFEDGFITNSDVYAINQMIAKNTKTVPWLLKKKTGDKIEVITSGQLYELIQQPNANQSREEYVEQASIDYTVSGNLFQLPEVAFGFTRPTAIHILHPQLTHIKTKYIGKFNTVDFYEYCVDGKRYKILPQELTHLKYYNPSNYGINSLRGLSPLTAGYLTVIGLTGNQTASASIYKHQGVAGILSNNSEYPLLPDQQKEEQKRLDDRIAGASIFGKVLQSSAKVSYTRLGLDPSQMKLIEGKVLKMRDLCSIYDVNSILLNDPANSSHNNVHSAEVAFWKKAVIPNAKSIIKAFDAAVVSKFNEIEFPTGKSKYFIEPDVLSIESLQEDATAKATRGRSISETIIRIMTSPITSEQKVESLVESLGVTTDRAKIIVFGK